MQYENCSCYRLFLQKINYMHCFDAGGGGRSNCPDRRHLFARKLSTYNFAASYTVLALSHAYDSTLAASKHQENGKKTYRNLIFYSITNYCEPFGGHGTGWYRVVWYCVLKIVLKRFIYFYFELIYFLCF